MSTSVSLSKLHSLNILHPLIEVVIVNQVSVCVFKRSYLYLSTFAAADGYCHSLKSSA